MRRALYEGLGVLLVLASIVFFLYAVRFLGDRDYIAAILEIFVGFALIRAGLEMTKLALAARNRST